MLKKTITYPDYDGNSITEDFYFNLNRAELLEMHLTTPGGMKNKLQKIIDAQNQVEMVNEFKSIILKAYGVKSEDGKRLIKSDELREAFVQTEAYSQLYVELLTNAEAAAAFINAIIPQESVIPLNK